MLQFYARVVVELELRYVQRPLLSVSTVYSWQRFYISVAHIQSPRARRAAQSSLAARNCRNSETAEARERRSTRNIDQRKRRLDSEGAEKKETRISNETLGK